VHQRLPAALSIYFLRAACYNEGNPRKGTGAMITNELQKRIFNGDREAFRAVYQKYGRGVYLDALKALGNETTARGVVKQTFLNLHNELMCKDEDIDLQERIRALADQETLLVQVLGSPSGEEAGAAVAAHGSVPAEAPQEPSAVEDYADDSETADTESDEETPDDLPPLERTHAYMRADGEEDLQAMRERASKSPKQGRWLGSVLLALFLLILLWVLGGILMDLGILPFIDLGYSWFNETIFQLFKLGA